MFFRVGSLKLFSVFSPAFPATRLIFGSRRNSTQPLSFRGRRLALMAGRIFHSLNGGLSVNLISIDAVSQLTGLSSSTLAKKRCNGSGPAFFKLGRQIKYDRSDLEAWITSRRRTSTWQPANIAKLEAA
jgi:predicted DNA-binding transcriptional regulator AlpA